MNRIISQALIKDIADSRGLTESESEFALRYLSYYYQDPQIPKSLTSTILPPVVLTSELVTEYVCQLQQVLGLTVDGQLNTNIIKIMQFAPRCGVPN